MANLCYTVNEPGHPLHGKTIYDGRYACVTAIVIWKRKNGQLYLLVNKRGIGCSTFPGKWNITCGFMENTENGAQCASREVFEECGIKIPANRFNFYNLETDPARCFQGHVIIRYIAVLTDEDFENGVIDTSNFNKIGTTGGEENEVADRRWIRLFYYYNYDWAFDQKTTIEELIFDRFSSKHYK